MPRVLSTKQWTFTLNSFVCEAGHNSLLYDLSSPALGAPFSASCVRYAGGTSIRTIAGGAWQDGARFYPFV